MENEIYYEVEKNIDVYGGIYFSEYSEAKEYYEREIEFCLGEIQSEIKCDDYEIFSSIQINRHEDGIVDVIEEYEI